ncbi:MULTISPECIES: nitrate/nitrite transporter [Rhodococcus]|uniref:MFS transporter n=1 Tax=Rhodococcus aetherivorans TaxID=191292 RepID=N1LY63_9NOCA|nr:MULTISPECIES: MFS transporter [Rhodococcus]ETT23585.1 major facilitator superfamily MFS_1 [Rhodococcus rhodochrous ATCC 21198]ANZ23476.1 MFS transporter [Rhodococcus sp. WB1]KDE10752.1 MFS transporter [Rhodococcus aetherivorans]MBC2589550.1 MFS transporter [Rhodococcus aetherivorans]MDV6296333.1 MFS transporter [Rhodococcus aetherivorans]
MKRVWWVWGVGVLAYVVAVMHRTSFGVSGLAATERFDITPAVLSGFVVLQIVVYASMQIPAGVLLDRFGSRVMIASGAAIMAVAQLVLAFTESLPAAYAARVFVGAGDALTFISVLRLVPVWFDTRRVPLVSQLTGILGQLGQVLSALPFVLILGGAGWSAAFASAAALGVLACVLAVAVVRDAPPGVVVRTEAAGMRQVLGQIGVVWRRPGTRLGFFTHMGTQFSITTFALLWGVPYLQSAQGLSAAAAGSLLTLSVVSAIAAGPVLGILSGRFPLHRSWLVLSIMVSNAAMWTVVLLLPAPAPMWLLVLLIVTISVGGPGSMIGFDYARTFNPSTALGTAQGMVNIGGFLASLLVIQAMGLILQRLGGYTFEAFRVAWLAQYPVWVVAIIGVLVTRGKARREAGVSPRTLRQVLRDGRRAGPANSQTRIEEAGDDGERTRAD